MQFSSALLFGHARNISIAVLCAFTMAWLTRLPEHSPETNPIRRK
jgi:hypothetical protein